MYFQMKRTLKSNRYYNTKKTLKAILIIFLKKKNIKGGVYSPFLE